MNVTSTTAAQPAETLTPLQINAEQAASLQTMLEIAKAFSSPSRLAIIGFLALRLPETVSVAQLTSQLTLDPKHLQRDLNQLVEAGIMHLEARLESGTKPVQEIRFNPQYLKTMPQLIATLHQINNQLQPAKTNTPMDERAKTVGNFIKDGKLVSWPSQLKRQVYVVEEIAKVFEPGVQYSEQQIDGILKEIYEYDHCTLRRYLVDLHLLQRANGTYWRN